MSTEVEQLAGSCLSRNFNFITMLLLSINYIIVFNQSSAKFKMQVSINKECEKELDYSIFDN